MARAQPDGHTLLCAPQMSFNADLLYPDINDDPRGFEPVSVLATYPNVIVGRQDLPFSGVPDLLDAARAGPDGITYGSQGNGQIAHLTFKMLDAMTGVRMVHVPYRGSAPLLTALLSGEVDISADNLLLMNPQVAAGMLAEGRLHHIAFELRDWGAVKEACDTLGARRIPLIWGPGRHTVGHNVHICRLDPDGQILVLHRTGPDERRGRRSTGSAPMAPGNTLAPAALGDGPLHLERLGHPDTFGIPRCVKGGGEAPVRGSARLDAAACRHDLGGFADVHAHDLRALTIGPDHLEVVVAATATGIVGYRTAGGDDVFAQPVPAPVGLGGRSEVELVHGCAGAVAQREAGVASLCEGRAGGDRQQGGSDSKATEHLTSLVHGADALSGRRASGWPRYDLLLNKLLH